MNTPLTGTLSTILLGALLVAVVISDMRWRRIPNWLTLGGAASGIGLALATGGPQAALGSLGGWLLGLGLLLPLFLMRGMGGGDVKLLAAVGAFAGPIPVLTTMVWAGLIGGVFALAILTFRRQLGAVLLAFWTTWRLPRLGDTGAVTLPYGVAIAAGGLITLFLEGGGF